MGPSTPTPCKTPGPCIYSDLSGEIHSDWRGEVAAGVRDAGLAVESVGDPERESPLRPTLGRRADGCCAGDGMRAYFRRQGHYFFDPRRGFSLKIVFQLLR